MKIHRDIDLRRDGDRKAERGRVGERERGEGGREGVSARASERERAGQQEIKIQKETIKERKPDNPVGLQKNINCSSDPSVEVAVHMQIRRIEETPRVSAECKYSRWVNTGCYHYSDHDSSSRSGERSWHHLSGEATSCSFI